jgi:hypothetical protein
MIQTLYKQIAAGRQNADDIARGCWEWVCRNIRYPLRWGRFVDKHELHAFGLRRIRSTGEFFQMPYQTMVVRIGDCFDRSALLCSLLRNMTQDVRVVVGSYDQPDSYHAWIEYDHPGDPYLIETTLPEPGPWKLRSQMAQYRGQVEFNDLFVREIVPMDDELFSRCNCSLAHIASIRRCWDA